MPVLILIHVLSAVFGVGPTFAMHLLVRKNQTLGDLRQSVVIMHKLEYFPKIGGTIAALSGLLLVTVGDYGTFLQIWLMGALVIYILIQVVVFAFLSPAGRRLREAVYGSTDQAPDAPLNSNQAALLGRLNNVTYIITTLAMILFLFMILKPRVQL